MKRAVAGIVNIDSKILIGKKIIKEGHFLSGGWHIPGGHTVENESEVEALLREFKEETRLDIKIIRKLCNYEIKENGVVVSWFLCTADSSEAIPGDDLDQIEFVEKNKVIEKCDKRAVTLWPKEVIDYFSKS